MTEATTLRWRAHEAAISPELHEPPIQFPELPPAPLDKAKTLLRVAAQIEHALMVQYLYAGYSFSEPQRTIIEVAIEEMSHLMTVQNLLRLIGEPPHLLRQDFETPADDNEWLFPFALRLEPLSPLSLAKYVVAESPSAPPPGVDPAVLARIAELAIGPNHEKVNRVGILYMLLAVVFGSEELLAQLAEKGDPWHIAVNQLAAEAEVFYGGRDKLHLPDSAFHPETVADQGSDPDWDRSVERTSGAGPLDEFRVHLVGSREDALEALRDIGLQGEGPSVVANETAHFRRFFDLFLEFFGADGTGTEPPQGVMMVPSGSRIVLDEASFGENVISHPRTMRWARLADLRYAILLGSLQRFLSAPNGDRAFLRGWCFAEMFALTRLAVFLPGMLRGVGDAPRVAALPFNLPSWLGTGARWEDLVAAFDESLAIAGGLRGEGGLAPEHEDFLLHLLPSDERKRREAQARAEGTTQRSRTDEVRDVLDWAAGAGNPPAFAHDNKGRFWNLPHDEFFQSVTKPPASGHDPLMIAKLKTTMPKDRPKLDPNGEEFKLLKKWIDDGRPE